MSKFDMMWKNSGESLKGPSKTTTTHLGKKIEEVSKEIASIKVEYTEEQIKAHNEILRHQESLSQQICRQALAQKCCEVLSLVKINPRDSGMFGNSQIRTGTGGNRNLKPPSQVYKVLLSRKAPDEHGDQLFKIIGNESEVREAIWQNR